MVVASSPTLFGLGGAGQAPLRVQPFVDIGHEIEDPAAFDELWPVAMAAHHGQGLFRQTGIGRGVFRVHAAVGESDYFEVGDYSLCHGCYSR